MTYECTLDSWINDGEPVTVTASYFPGKPGCNYLRNGDPGYPDEPAELVIVRVLDSGGNELELDEAACEELADRIAEDVADEYRTEVEEAQVSRYLASREYEA